MAQALLRMPDFPEWHDPALLRREKWPGFADALRTDAGARGHAGRGRAGRGRAAPHPAGV